jgi:hypothetical protein
MDLRPDSRLYTTHQILHLDALIVDLADEGATRALRDEAQDIRDAVLPWPDDRLHPYEIHIWFDRVGSPSPRDDIEDFLEDFDDDRSRII